jgi:hypothetical protein
MTMKIDSKQLGLSTLLGTAVVVATPLIYGFLAGFEPLAEYVTFEIIPNMLDIGTVVAAGLSAFVADLAITQWLE